MEKDKSVLLIETVDDDVAVNRRNLINSDSRLSFFKIGYCYLFDTQEDIDLWYDKLEKKSTFLPPSVYKNNPRINEIGVREEFYDLTDQKALRAKFTNKIDKEIKSCEPDIILVHVGVAFEQFPTTLVDAMYHVRENYPKIKIGFDVTDFKYQNTHGDTYNFYIFNHSRPLRLGDNCEPFTYYRQTEQVARLIYQDVLGYRHNSRRNNG